MNQHPATKPAARRVTIHGPRGQRHEYHLTDDDTISIDIDGTALLGVDARGAGWWPDPGEAWEPLRPGGTPIGRTVTIHGVSTEMLWRDLEAALHLPRYGLGRWKQWASDRPKRFGDDYDLNAAIDWATQHRLSYEDENAILYEPATTQATP